FNVSGIWLRLTNVVSGAGSLFKVGTSPLFLGSANPYTGDTIVNAGALALTNNGSIASSSNLVIAAGATLSAAGRFDGTLTLAAGQTLSGLGTVAGNLTAAS